MRKHSLALIAVLTAAYPAVATDRATAEARLGQAVAGRVAGAPVKCIPLRRIRSSQVIDGAAIVYEGQGNQIWVNRPARGAGILNDDDILVTTSRSALLCERDTVDLIDRGSHHPNGFILLGEFVPYTRVAVSARN